MLEILSHQCLKKFVNSHNINWEHIYSFGRIVSKGIQTKDNYLINSEIFSTDKWISALLISLFLYEENSTIVLPKEKITHLKKNQINNLKNFGFKFIFDNNRIVFPSHFIEVITFQDLVTKFNHCRFKKNRIIFTDIENIKKNLKSILRIQLSKSDWISKTENRFSRINQNIKTYDSLKQKFFMRKIPNRDHIFLLESEIALLNNFFCENSSFSDKFFNVSKAISDGWACWVQIDDYNFEWILHLEPFDELFEIKHLLSKNHFIFLSAFRKDNFFKKYLNNHKIDINLEINFKSNFKEKDILVYAPYGQIVPNNPLFTKTIIEKCNKLMLFRKGISLILSNEANLKINIATELASIHGKSVLLENIPEKNNEILCSSFDWWIKNLDLIRVPELIIVPLLPLPNLDEPIHELTILMKKKNSLDWFREFLLPELIEKLEKSVSPLRRNSGKLIILDGRINKRQWGKNILETIQPSKKINYMFPFD